ncbi:hypothetical protein U2A4042370031 [Corynebacterium striatum]|nr:hypothetical protein U2A4042370031 [Corynebacterium striatum]
MLQVKTAGFQLSVDPRKKWPSRAITSPKALRMLISFTARSPPLASIFENFWDLRELFWRLTDARSPKSPTAYAMGDARSFRRAS